MCCLHCTTQQQCDLCSVITSNFSSESGGGPLIETEQNLVLTWHRLQYPIHILTHLPPALFSDSHPVRRTHLRLPSDDLASVQRVCTVRVLLAAAELRQQTPCPLTPSTLATPTPTLMGKHFFLSSGGQLVFSLSQSLLPITPSLVHAACVSQRSCHGDTGDTVCRYPDVCAEKGPVAAADVECQLRPRPSVACQARTGPLSTTIHYPPLYSHLLSAPPITPAQNSTTTNHIYFNLFYILRYNFVNGNLLL